MAWQEELQNLRQEVLAAISRAVGEPAVEPPEDLRDREDLYQLAASLEIAQLLVDINGVVLSGAGKVESTSLLDYYDDEDYLFDMEDLDDEDPDEDDDDEDGSDAEEGEELRFSLFWNGSTECAIDVELGKNNGRIYLMVNGDEVRQSREVLETAVLDAFREEMDL